MQWMKRTWAEISLDTLHQNYRAIRDHIPTGSRFMGVVKADAYGHGAVPISRALTEFGADALSVSNLEEAVQLRKGGIQLPILLLGYTPASHAAELVQWNVTQSVHTLDYARQLSAAVSGTGQRLRVHFKIDTGMARIGFVSYINEAPLQDAVRAAALPGLEVEGAFTHFSSADSTDPDAQAFTDLQYERFLRSLDYLKDRGLEFPLRHCCNSGAILQYPQYTMDMVRSGIITYGLPVSEDLAGTLPLEPVLSLQTVVSQIKEIPAESPIGYSRTYQTGTPHRLATLAIGYADGLPVALSNNATVTIHGKRLPVVGRICMDMCMVDVTDAPEVREGDTATVIGGENSCAHLARQLNTIPYEVVCRISKRVPRVYLENGTEREILRYIG